VLNGEFTGFCVDTKMLVILLKEEDVRRSAFSTIHKINYNTAKSALDRLEALDLVIYDAKGDRRDTVYYSLTEKGKKAAQMLADLDEFIRNG